MRGSHLLIPREISNGYYLDHGCYTPDELTLIEETLERIWQELSAGKTPLPAGSVRRLEQITGVAGVGQSTLAHQLLGSPLRQDHSIFIDPDDIRNRTVFFKQTIEEGMANGSSYEDADMDALRKWNCACIYMQCSLLNRAAQNNYSILKQGRPAGTITDTLLVFAPTAGYRLETFIAHAPLEVCQASIEHRIKNNGHPSNMHPIDAAHRKFSGYLAGLFESSAQIELVWRPKFDAGLKTVWKASHGTFHTQDAAGLHDFLATLGEPQTIEANFAYFKKLHLQNHFVPSWNQ